MNDDDIIYTSDSDNYLTSQKRDFCSDYAPEPPSGIIRKDDFTTDFAPDPPVSLEND